MTSHDKKQVGVLPKVPVLTAETALEAVELVSDIPLPIKTGSSVQRVNKLLEAFSDCAASFEDEEHSWESWNYARLSTF